MNMRALISTTSHQRSPRVAVKRVVLPGTIKSIRFGPSREHKFPLIPFNSLALGGGGFTRRVEPEGAGGGAKTIPCRPRTFLRMFSTALLVWLGSHTAYAQQDENGVVRYAPGATGTITQDLVEMMQRAKRDAADLKERLTIQGPMSTPDYDVEAKRDAALSNTRVLELLGADGALDDSPPKDAWTNAHMFVFASFSLPDPMLRELLESADAMGVPVLFRGFYKNSVYETNDALMRIFEAPENIRGFSIDPTLFRQFDVTAVPTIVVLKDPYEMCATQACEDDTAPAHDRIAGALTLNAALEIIERGRGDAGEIATAILAEAREQ